jgi:hypothetical protein
MKLVCYAFFFLTFSTFAIAAPSHEKIVIDQFLQEIGFKKYSEEIDKNLKIPSSDRSVFINPVGGQRKDVLNFNRESMAILDNAREISATVISKHTETLKVPSEDRTKILRLAARLLNYQPSPFPTEFPQEIESIKDVSEREVARTKYVAQIVEKNIEKDTNALFSDLVDVLHGKTEAASILSKPDSKAFLELKNLQNEVNSYVNKTYLFPESGQTRYLGRAFNLAILREARLNKNLGLENELTEVAKKEGIILGNYTSNKLRLENSKNRIQEIVLKDGAFAHEYSRGREAWEITSAVMPSTFRDRIRAIKENALGHLLLLGLMPDESKLKEKLDSGKPLSYWDKFKMKVAQSRMANRGYSHIGMVFTNEHAETGLANPMIFDNYPNAENGGVRYVGVEQFATPGKFQRFGVVDYDPKAFLRYAKEEYKKNGYQSVIWEADFSDREGNPVKRPDGKKQKIKIEISKEEMEKILNYPDSKADIWWKNEMVPRLRRGMEKYVTRDGLGFAYGFTNVCGTAYCSSTIEKLYLKETGIDPIKNKDRYSKFVEWMKRVGVESAKDVDLNQRITAPGSPLWQSDLKPNHQQIDYPVQTALDQSLNLQNDSIEVFDRELNLMIQKNMPLDSLSKKSISEHESVFQELVEFVRDNELSDNKGMKGAVAERQMGGKSGRVTERKEFSPVEYSSSDKNYPVLKTLDSEIGKKDIEAKEFFDRTLLESYTASFQEKLDAGDHVGDIGKKTIEDNLQRYTMVDDARDISGFIYSRISDRLKNQQVQDRATELAARFLNLSAETPPLEIPESIKSLSDEKKFEALQRFYQDWAGERIRAQSTTLTSDIFLTIYGKNQLDAILQNPKSPESIRLQAEMDSIYKKVSRYLERVYFDAHIGKTKFLGRAFSSLLVRHDAVYKDTAMAPKLEKALQGRNQELRNFLAYDNKAKMILETQDGLKKIDIQNAAPVLSRSYTAESSQIISAAVPNNVSLAKELQLLSRLPPMASTVFQGALTVNPEELTEKQSRLGKRKQDFFQSKLNKGYSHVGMFNVKVDKESGVGQILIMDNYPSHSGVGLGGARILGPEQFAGQATSPKIGIVEFDKEKLYRHAKELQERYQKEGYPSVAFPGSEIEIVNGKRVKGKEVGWKVGVTREEFDKLMSIKDPIRWYEKWSNMVTDHARKNMLPGTWFWWVAEGYYCHGGTYCTQLLEVSSMASSMISLQKEQDHYRGYVKFFKMIHDFAEKYGMEWLKKIGPIKAAGVLPVSERILAPSGMAAQPHVKTVHNANYPQLSTWRQVHKSYQPKLTAMNPAAEKTIAPFLLDAQLEQIRNTKDLPEEYLKNSVKDYLLNFAVPAHADAGRDPVDIINQRPALQAEFQGKVGMQIDKAVAQAKENCQKLFVNLRAKVAE